jgi:hypothetical protein
MFNTLEDEQKVFDEDTVCMLLSCNSSLNMCDNPDFKAYIKNWTGRQAPSRSSVNKTIVPRLSQTINSHKDVINNAKWITIVSDSWTNIRNESITNYIANCPEPVFLRATLNQQKIKDSCVIADGLIKSVEICGIATKRHGRYQLQIPESKEKFIFLSFDEPMVQ